MLGSSIFLDWKTWAIGLWIVATHFYFPTPSPNLASQFDALIETFSSR